MGKTESIWSKSTVFPKREPLQGDRKADVAVIGGGMAGILTACFLSRQGADVVVLEAETVGSGQTKNTTAKITAQHGLIYRKLIEEFGEEKAGQYARANQRAVEDYRQLIQQEGIDCGLEEKCAYLYSALESEPLAREAEAAARLGLDAEYKDSLDLPVPVKGAVCFRNQAQFHPLQFLEALARPLQIYEHTMVIAIEEGRAVTAHGNVQADHLVMATHFPFLNTPGYYFMRMHQERSYVLALEGAKLPQGMYLGVDQDGLSFRTSGDLLLLGGGNHRTGENSAGGQYEFLRGAARRLYPDSKEVAHWSAQDCMPMDSVPYIGQFSASAPGLYVATGFGKWGMTTSMVAARILSEQITGRTDSCAEVFSPHRFQFSASGKSLMEDGLQAVKGLARGFLKPPKATIDHLPKGHGGVVEYDGHKVGVYKNDQGETFIVLAKCPHLGCQLEWNPDELSWDCPCHGSRFDYKGDLLDNPAMKGLEHE